MEKQEMIEFIERMTNFFDVRFQEEGVYFARTFQAHLPRVTLEVSELEKNIRININEIGHSLYIEKGEK